MPTENTKTETELFRTRCAKCQTKFSLSPSLAMQCGTNTGHCNCPNPDCGTFLHVELLEGEAWTEVWGDYMKRYESAPGGA